MIIKALNNLTVGAPKTSTTFPEVAGTNVLRWQNPNGFGASWAIQVGNTGEEKAEVVLLGASTPAGTAGTLTANTAYDHPTNTPIYATKYDQIVFERSTAGTAGTATPMTGGTVTIQADQDFTQFDDTSGSTSYAYRTYFRSSVLAVNSTESDWITPAGFSFYSLAKMRERVKSKLWKANFVSDDEIDDWHNEWAERMRNAAISTNEDYALGTVDVAITAGLGTITATDFMGGITRAWVTTNGGTFEATKQGQNQFIPGQIFNSTRPYFYMQGENVIGINPADSGTVTITYPSLAAQMVNDTDELPVSMRGYTKSFVDYALSQAYYKDVKIKEAQLKENNAEAQLNRFKMEIAPRLKTGATMIDIVESLGGESDVF